MLTLLTLLKSLEEQDLLCVINKENKCFIEPDNCIEILEKIKGTELEMSVVTNYNYDYLLSQGTICVIPLMEHDKALKEEYGRVEKN